MAFKTRGRKIYDQTMENARKYASLFEGKPVEHTKSIGELAKAFNVTKTEMSRIIKGIGDVVNVYDDDPGRHGMLPLRYPIDEILREFSEQKGA